MAKLTLVGDPHVKNNNLQKIDLLFDIIEDLGNPTLILGDLFDTKEIMRGKSYNYIRERLKNSKLHFTILVGNHDYFNLDCLDHSLQSLKDLPNVTIVDEMLNLGSTTNIFAIPYIHDREKFKKSIMNLLPGDALFCHQGFSGFDYGNGFIAEGESDLAEIEHIGTVISGHFHKYQKAGNLTYLGTPFSHSYGESNQNKYLGVFDTVTHELELLASPFPQHRTYEIEAGEEKSLDQEELKSHYLRFIIRGTQSQLNSYDKEYLRSLSDVEVKIIEKPIDDFQADVTINEASDNLAQFQTWAKDIKKIDTKTINLGLKILGALSAK